MPQMIKTRLAPQQIRPRLAPRKIRTRLAPQQSENGSACLAMLAESYGTYISLIQAARLCGVTQDGCTFEQIEYAASTLDLHPELRNISDYKKLDRPCIVKVKDTYVILYKILWKKAILYTPDKGRITMDAEEFQAACSNVALLLSHSDKKQKSASFLTFALSLITRQNIGYTISYALLLAGVAVLLLFVSLTAGEITNYIFPSDESLINNITNFYAIFYLSFFGQLVLVACMILLLILETVMVSVFSRFSARVESNCRKRFLWSSINLPLDYYQIRSERYFMESSGKVQELGLFLSKQFLDVIVRPVLAIVFMVIMACISIQCFLVVLGSIVVMAAATLISARYQDRKGRIVFTESSRESGFLLEGIKAIRSIKNSSSEYQFFRNYVDLNRKSAKTLGKYNAANRIFDDIPMSISNFTKLVLILVGVYGVYEGNLTLGSLIYIHGIYCIVSDYIRTAVFSSKSLLSLRYNLENLKELTGEGERTCSSTDRARESTGTEAEYVKLKGHIRLDHVTFGYNRNADPVLSDISMDIPVGSCVAIVGSSGCGKTTLKKLICGRHKPWTGQILYDEIPSSDVPDEVMINSIASVDQQIILFSDTVKNNIKMWDATQLDADAILAARDAQIHDDIIMREGKYNTQLTEDGNNFSGGQRQRIEIARALSMDPSILVMDEATSALDTIVEKEIVEQVRARGITTIVIAHRLSTIRSCDCIYVLDHGRIEGQGTHEELMQSCDLYRTLVTVE